MIYLIYIYDIYDISRMGPENHILNRSNTQPGAQREYFTLGGVIVFKSAINDGRGQAGQHLAVPI